VGVPDVEAFQSKCRDTHVDRGIIVSSSGFRRTALLKAINYNIRCFGLEETKAFDWCRTPGIAVHARSIDAVSIVALPAEPTSDDARFFVDPDTIWTNELASNFVNQCVNDMRLECDGDAVFPLVVVANVPDLHAREPDGRRIRVPRLSIQLRVHVRVTFAPFELRTYQDAAAQRQLYTTAVANVAVGAATGSLVVVHKEGEGAKVSWVPDAAMIKAKAQ
jgi:hypothetical protein